MVIWSRLLFIYCLAQGYYNLFKNAQHAGYYGLSIYFTLLQTTPTPLLFYNSVTRLNEHAICTT